MCVRSFHELMEKGKSTSAFQQQRELHQQLVKWLAICGRQIKINMSSCYLQVHTHTHAYYKSHVLRNNCLYIHTYISPTYLFSYKLKLKHPQQLKLKSAQLEFIIPQQHFNNNSYCIREEERWGETTKKIHVNSKINIKKMAQ